MGLQCCPSFQQSLAKGCPPQMPGPTAEGALGHTTRCRMLRSGRVGCRAASWAGRAAAAHSTRDKATSPAGAHCYILGTLSARHFSKHMNLKQN